MFTDLDTIGEMFAVLGTVFFLEDGFEEDGNVNHGYYKFAPSFVTMSEWRRDNPQAAREAQIRDNARRKEKRKQMPKAARKKGPNTKIVDAELVRLVNAGETNKIIAARFGSSEPAVSKARKRLGLGMPLGWNRCKV